MKLKRLIELDQSDVGDAIRDWVVANHPELWKPGVIEAVLQLDSMSKFIITWTLSDEMTKGKKR